MTQYKWSTQHREGTATKKPNYSVKWEWRDPEKMGDDYTQKTDLVSATNAERAITKVRKLLLESRDFPIDRKSDIVIIHVVPIDGVYYNL